jgi:hypothetical protein
MKDEDIPDLKAVQTLLKNKNIKVIAGRTHTKASEEYVDVVFNYPEQKATWEGSVPIEYRRTGVSARTEKEIAELLDRTYEQTNPKNYDAWAKEQKAFWDASSKKVTRPFFEALKDCAWKCIACELPTNPNWARRFQDIKEFGYTIATNTSMYCKKCKKNTTHIIMLPLPRGHATGYETWSATLRKKIIDTLGSYDVYEDRKFTSLLPDHKFPEIRWDEKTREENSESMSTEQIKNKFQLLSNQRNQQKREVCRNCYQTGKRGYPYGIEFFYEGTSDWPKDIPKTGKDAENGCVGCGWYDLKAWREKLNELISS